MTGSYEDYISIDEVLADGLVNVDDEGFKFFTRGWYKRQVRVGLERLNYQAPFVEMFKDVSLPSDLVLAIPKGVYNIKDMFLWSGDDCVIESSKRVFWKKNQSLGYGHSFTANKKAGQSDPFIPYTGTDNLYFYNINMGNIIFSDVCSSYSNVRLVYDGFPSEIGSVKFIPPFCREALIGFITERVFFALKSRDVAYRVLWVDARQDLYVGMGFEPSKWDYAVHMCKKIDTKIRNDVQKYLSKMNY